MTEFLNIFSHYLFIGWLSAMIMVAVLVVLYEYFDL